MSEAMLFAIDARDLTDAGTAAELVDHWRDSREAPTSRIAAFFEALLQTWPEDGSKGAVWYEDFTHNKPAGPMLEMTFDLDEFDEERLGQLRSLAGQHGLCMFDPEGEVLYLPDGSEAVA